MFDLIVAAVAVVAGSIAAVAGFGIGSLLTPVVAVRFGTKLAVAIVAVPHFIGTAFRFGSLWRHVDRRVLLRFGVFSAVGGLAGALLNARVSSPALTIVFAFLLLFAGTSTLFGLTEKMRDWVVPRGQTPCPNLRNPTQVAGGGLTPLRNPTQVAGGGLTPFAWIAGALSGLFGGLVGNQGGIRSAALLGFNIPKESFVAIATAIGLVVDVARLPVYLATQHHGMWKGRSEIVVATIGVLAGTIFGVRFLRRIPEQWFRRAVAILIILLGTYMLFRGDAL